MEGTAGEMAQWLGTLAALPEDPGSIAAPTWQLTTVCNSVRGDPVTPHRQITNAHTFKKQKTKQLGSF